MNADARCPAAQLLGPDADGTSAIHDEGPAPAWTPRHPAPVRASGGDDSVIVKEPT